MSNPELTAEQDHLDSVYARLDHERGLARQRHEAALALPGGETAQARAEREAEISRYADRVGQLGAVEHQVCFGRLDLDTGERRYVGRLGLAGGDDADPEPLLIDWRAPAARPFYLATAAAPDGVRRRRHLRTVGRRVHAYTDDVLDLAAAAAAPGDGGLVGEAALLAAVSARRTGQMGDIVATIQAEQDRIIRAGDGGVLVVQGGPGTGKTAVALHRAAYLLYTHRRRLSSHGVLVVGPNPTFLRYIEQVLPALGEGGVLAATVGALFPGVRPGRPESPEVAELKGRPVMAEILARAVSERQEVPEDVLEVEIGTPGSVDHEVLLLDAGMCARARDKARARQLTHNAARPVFDQAMVAALARQVTDRLGADPHGGPNLLDADDLVAIERDLAGADELTAALDRLWPILTPQRLLSDLFGSPDRLAAAAPGLTAAERATLARDPGGWSAADVPLLDEAAELLGEDDRAERAAAAERRRAEIRYAMGVLEVLAGEQERAPLRAVTADATDAENEQAEELRAVDLLDAETLADRFGDEVGGTVAARAATDRTWTFGHVIVDEAQELSAMAWRLLMRRCPSRSMTLVGDVAQTGDPAGTRSWGAALSPFVGDRWRRAELTVNYRTPAEIMALAEGVLAAIDPALRPPESVRESGVPPRFVEVDEEEQATRADALAKEESVAVEGGRVAVITVADTVDLQPEPEPPARLRLVTAADLPEPEHADGPDLTEPIVRLSPAQAKGLEFDAVVLVDPAAIIAASPSGLSDLYVAMTRATTRLTIVHTGPLPACLTWPSRPPSC